MNLWNFASQFVTDNFAGAFLGGLAFVLFSGFIWRTAYKWVHRNFPDGKNGLVKIIESVKIPGYLIFLLLGLRTFFVLAPAFQSKDSWVIAVDLAASFLAVIMIGEGFFAFFIDFYLPEHRKTEIPAIFKQLFKFIVYLIAGLSFLSTTYKVDITPLLTTSAVLSMVIGLALQDVLGNLFSGVSVHISPPFKIGDWIRVGGYFGKVIESNWRATTLRMSTKEIVVLPNNDIAKKDIVNHSYQEGLLMFEFMMGISYTTSPEKVRKTLLGAAEQVGGIVTLPQPQVFMDGFGDSAINYRIRYWIPENVEQPSIRDQLASRIWYHLKRESITIPYPIREVYTHPEKDDHDQVVSHRLALLSEIDFLKKIDRKHQVFIAESLKELWYEPGEVVVKRGSNGAEFYIIDHGQVSVFLADTPAQGNPVATLKPGEFFGEMSLLTGEPRSATIVADSETCLLMLNQDTVQRILEETPHLANLLSDVLAVRSAKNQAQKIGTLQGIQNELDEKLPTAEDLQNSSVIFERIKRFFRLR